MNRQKQRGRRELRRAWRVPDWGVTMWLDRRQLIHKGRKA